MKIPQALIARLAFSSVTLLAACSAHAAWITGVTIQSVSSENGSRPAELTIDGSGLNEVAGTHDDAAITGWLGTGAPGSPGDTEPTIVFDLGEIYLIDSFTVWNYNQSANGATVTGIQDVIITYSETLAPGTVLTSVTSFSQADGTPTYAGEMFNLASPISARYIQFDATSNYGGPATGLAEVRFNAVPEPSTFTLLGGVLLLMFARRRR